ncbi:MAG: hypothetical protein ACFFCV_01660 [Promethearchaeota archaeon]
MDAKEFINQLNYVQELMQEENYKEAIIILEKLKELDKNTDFDYNLTHRLYQLDSNTRSLYNQEIILKLLTQLSTKTKKVSFDDLKQKLMELNNLDLSVDILRREIEILILRNLLACRIDGEFLIF